MCVFRRDVKLLNPIYFNRTIVDSVRRMSKTNLFLVKNYINLAACGEKQLASLNWTFIILWYQWRGPSWIREDILWAYQLFLVLAKVNLPYTEETFNLLLCLTFSNQCYATLVCFNRTLSNELNSCIWQKPNNSKFYLMEYLRHCISMLICVFSNIAHSKHLRNCEQEHPLSVQCFKSYTKFSTCFVTQNQENIHFWNTWLFTMTID